VVLGAMMVFQAMTSWPLVLDLYAPNAWRLGPILYQEALRIVPQETYLREVSPAYGAARLVDANVPKGERVLAANGVADAYTSRDVLVSYHGALNESLLDSINIGWLAAFQPRVLETFSFPERAVRRIRVLQTGTGDPPEEQWSVHELRIFRGGAELPRRSEWRLRAWPNPWDVQLAFDNSPATRWRTWESARPGNYLDVDFGRPENLDQVRIETSYDYLHIKTVLQAMNEAGNWVAIGGDPVPTAIDPGRNVRHAATAELSARGIHYLLMHDVDFGADDIAGDPEGWGLTQIAAGYGIKLYRVSQ
jgi:hypothetical protein